MKLNDIRAPQGANQKRKRVGRGHGSGSGKTAGRGHGGQNSRSGGGVRPGFEGGQMPLNRRIPKFGFVNIFRKQFSEVKLLDLENMEQDLIDPDVLLDAGLVRSGMDGIKVLGTGEITRAITLKVDRITKGARAKVEAAGGTVELIEPRKPVVDLPIGRIDKVDGDVIDLDVLVKAGLVPEGTERVRIVKRGKINSKKTFKEVGLSRNSRRAIKAVGGKIEENS